MLKILIVIFFLSISTQIKAQRSIPPELNGICAYASSASELSDEEKEKYNYEVIYRVEEKIYLLSGVNIGKDSPAVVRAKVQQFWKKYEDHLICDSPDFNVPNGSLIKFAAARKFEDFIDDVIEWGVPLNKVDASDNRTVLDYLAHERDKHKGTPLEAVYSRYLKKLREAGAKYRAEL